MRRYYIYILSNHTNRALYIGVTNSLSRRVEEHKRKAVRGFSEKYNLYKLLYFEEFTNINHAIEREKVLKKWKREWKLELIRSLNPDFKNLTKDYNLVIS